jgi:hypothetical protein
MLKTSLEASNYSPGAVSVREVMECESVSCRFFPDSNVAQKKSRRPVELICGFL